MKVKKIKNYLLPLVCCAVLSCNEVPIETRSNNISFTVENESSGEINSPIGVYANYTGDNALFLRNEMFIENNGIFSSTKQDYLKRKEAVMYLYAPYQETVYDILSESLIFNIPINQVGDNILRSDFIYAKSNISDYSNVQEVKMRHLLSQLTVKFDIESDQKVKNSEVNFKLFDQPATGNINLKDGTIESTTNIQTIWVKDTFKNSNGVVEGLTMNLFPTTITSGKIFAEVIIDGVTYDLVSDKNITLSSGNRTALTIKIADLSARVEVELDITDWLTDAEIDYDMDLDNGDLSIEDIDGNKYKVVEIGDYLWMAENLRVRNYTDGTPIHHSTDTDAWQLLTQGAFCTYDHAAPESSKDHFLYNFYAAETDKLCPTGWHVPTLDEWYSMADVFGGKDIAGTALKSIHSWDNDGGGTNASDLDIKAVGTMEAWFKLKGTYAYLWTSTALPTKPETHRYAVYLSSKTEKISHWGFGASKIRGYSIRCIKQKD